MSKQIHEFQQLQYAQRERLAFIDYNLEYIGKVSRNTLIECFGVGPASCSRDFRIYNALSPDNAVLRHHDKFYYRKDTFKPLFEHDAGTVLKWLSEGFGYGLSNQQQKTDWVISPQFLSAPAPRFLGRLSRAIALNKALLIVYHCAESGVTEREIVPHAIANVGEYWIVRAFDRSAGEFTDYIGSRIESAEELEKELLECESALADEKWQGTSKLELIAHPSLKYKSPVEMDFGMTNGRTVINVRTALVHYFLRFMRIDTGGIIRSSDQNFNLLLVNSKDVLRN